MSGEAVVLPLSLLFSFLLVLTRVSGVLLFVPIPGIKSGPEPVRVVLALSITCALYLQWPSPPSTNPSVGILAGWLAAEAALGLLAGVGISFITEAFGFAAQMISLQAGYSYATTIDPTAETESTVLGVFSQLLTGLLFFVLRLDHLLIRAFAHSLSTYPPGKLLIGQSAVQTIFQLGAGSLSVGLRLALPLLALLIVIDVLLGLLGRLNPNLQLTTLAFPAKMLVFFGVLGSMLALYPAVYRDYSSQVLTTVIQLLHR